MDTKTFYQQLQKDAEDIARKALAILESMQGKETVAVQKDEEDLSTSADLAAEKCIVDFIKNAYPTHGIYSEELGEIKGSEPYRWVIDPLDQTKEYFRGLSEYNCLIGIEYNGEPVVGVTLQHGINMYYTGSKGNGAFMNGLPIHVSDSSVIENMFIGFNLPHRKLETGAIDRDLSLLGALVHTVYRVRPFWDQSKAMAWVARGVLDANVVPADVFKWHDMASSVITVQEAGGVITDWLGNAVTEKTVKNGVLASNSQKTHTQLLALIQKALLK
jgi:myo-inositol-1(or 4)-monophosphatase